MLEERNKRNKTHLINLIGRRSNNTPNFALLIGAGASVSSGVKTAGEMIEEWRKQLYKQSKSEEKYDKWLEKQEWYEDDDEYSILFEKFCDQRSHRRIYLSNIIAHNYFNVIFTPNFDDLLNEACFLYSDLRPIVCAHDSAVVDIRVTSARPKIIKLHGDFLYDSIKNTIRETETLEKNMRDKFMQFAREYGIVVIGYGGNDRSIMDILDTILRSEGYFPNGLYWCVRRATNVSSKLNRLLQRENTYWIEIDGFDEFMAELHEGLRLSLPDYVKDPYKATTERLNRFILLKEEVKHPIIKKCISELVEQVEKFERVISGKTPVQEFDRLVPYRFLGNREFENDNYGNALIYYKKALLQNPNNLDTIWKIVRSYSWIEDFEKALEMSENMIKQAPDNYVGYREKGHVYFYIGKFNDSIKSYNEALKHATNDLKAISSIYTGRSNTNLKAGNWRKALSDAEEALQIDPENYAALLNKCIALKKLDRGDEVNEIIQRVLPELDYKYHRAAAFAIIGDKENMLNELKAAIKEDSGNQVAAKFDPDFLDYQKDKDFQKLILKSKKKKKKN
jgi:tetratricopeptide (TPR) repeat protein